MVVCILFLHLVRVLHVAVRAGRDCDCQRSAEYSMAVHWHIRSNDFGHAGFWMGRIQVSTKNIPPMGLLFFYREHFDFFCRFHVRTK